MFFCTIIQNSPQLTTIQTINPRNFKEMRSKSNEQVEPISLTRDSTNGPILQLNPLIAPAHSTLNSQAEYSLIFISRVTATEYIT